jgi:putative endonuclease
MRLVSTGVAWLRRLLRGGQSAPGCGAGDESDTGRWGEDQAVAHLTRAGYRILGRRVRPDRRDEIDIVARREGVLVFVEVKTRATEQFGRPAEAVNRAKRHALNRAAVRYLRRLGHPRLACRFDVIEVIGRPGAPVALRQIENAFPFEPRHLFRP